MALSNQNTCKNQNRWELEGHMTMTCEMRAREDDDDAEKLTPVNMFSFFFFFVLFLIVLGCCFYIKRIFSWYTESETFPMASQSPTLISPFLCLHPLLTVSATSTVPTAFCLKKEKKEQTQKDPLALFCVCCPIGMHSFVSLLSSFVSPPPLLQLNEIIRRTIEWQILPSLLPPSPEKFFWQ